MTRHAFQNILATALHSLTRDVARVIGRDGGEKTGLGQFGVTLKGPKPNLGYLFAPGFDARGAAMTPVETVRMRAGAAPMTWVSQSTACRADQPVAGRVS
mgnify:FL=1